MTRAKLCVRDEAPTIFNLEENEMKISLNDKETKYEERLFMQEKVEEPLRIGFSSRLVLDTIKGPEDVKRLNEEERKELAAEIREFLIETTSRTGGHLASNLGVVELTIAMFCALNLPKDKIIWDVGHQLYAQDLSGRKDNLMAAPVWGLSGFPKRKESPFDAFDTGHSSTSDLGGAGDGAGARSAGRGLFDRFRHRGRRADRRHGV